MISLTTDAMGDEQRKVHPASDIEAPARQSTTTMPLPAASKPRIGPVLVQPIHHPPRPYSTNANACCRCICWTLSLLAVAIVTLAIVAAVLYLVFRPKLPDYSVDSLRVTDLKINYDLTLHAQFNVKITARNPNKKIGIYYEKGGHISVWYTKTKLCEGPIPKFYQGYQNVTRLDMVLSGNPQYGNDLMSGLQQQQQTGRVPLDLKVVAPVAVRLGTLKLRKVKILGDCNLVVDSLSANSVVSIKASDCDFGLKL